MEAVFFDFDGVICDSVNIKTEAFAEMYSKFGPEIVEKVIDYHINNNGISRYEKFQYWENTFFGKYLSEDELKEKGRVFSELVVDKIITAHYINGVLETLNLLKSKNIPTYIISGTPDNEIKMIIEKKGLSKYFRDVHGSPKSKSEIVDMILSSNRFSPKDCLFIGDAMSDFLAAKEFDIPFLGVLHDYNMSIFPVNTNITSKIDIQSYL
jgi:phosphoglycolate phosphatase-like HAD superfamily hydrolase